MSENFAAFYVGSARWRAGLHDVVDPLVPLLSRPHHPWTGTLTQPYALASHTAPSGWQQWLGTCQQMRCFWCGRHLTTGTVSLEHVLPHHGTLWQHADRLTQLLSLRLSHRDCNWAYAAWRAHQTPRRLQRMDFRMVRLIVQIIAQTPALRLILLQQALYNPTYFDTLAAAGGNSS